jgi:DNA 3'-phosphatase
MRARVSVCAVQDGTLVATKGGGSFAANANDWRLLHGRAAAALRELHDAGYRIVVFRRARAAARVAAQQRQREKARSCALTSRAFLRSLSRSLLSLSLSRTRSRARSNQNGIKSAVDGKRAATVRGYFDASFAAIGVPVTAYAAPAKDAFRKPLLGMWRALLDASLAAGVAVDAGASFFVGDAAGRAGDHSADDLNFAKAAGLRFFLPEEAFAEGWAPLAEARATSAAAGAAGAGAEEEVVVVIDDKEEGGGGAAVATTTAATPAKTAGDSAADALVVL